MASRFTAIATNLLIAGSVGASLYAANTASDARSTIGAGTSSYVDPLTTNGDMVVRSGGATGRLGTASAPDGGVLTVANGAPQWAASGGGGGGGGGGPAYGSGTYAARPVTCAVGDRYQVTSGARTGSVYICTATDTWALDTILPPTAVAPLGWWDVERLEPYVGQTLTSWRAEGGFIPLFPVGHVSVQPTVLAAASAWGGLPAASWAAGAGPLLSYSTGALWAKPRTFVAVVSAIDTGGTRAIGGWGRNGAGLQTWAIRAVGANTGLSFYGTDPTGSGATPSTSTPAVLVATYSGTQYALRQATLAASPSWSYSIAATSLTLNTYRGGILIGAHPWDTGYGSDPYVGRIHWIGVYATALSEGESDALAIALHTRLQ